METTEDKQNLLVNLYTWVRQLGCTHNHMIRERNVVNNDVTEYLLVCENCGKSYEIPFILTRASGVFAAIDDRLEDSVKYAALIESAEQYQAEAR